jgi:hypothetical protein
MIACYEPSLSLADFLLDVTEIAEAELLHFPLPFPAVFSFAFLERTGDLDGGGKRQ